MTSGSASNRWRTEAFRNDVVLLLRDAGFPQATRNEAEPAKLSELIREGRGDVLGLSWALTVRRQQTIDLSASLSAAEWRADATGQTRYAAVHHRKGRSIQDAYVTMPMTVFREILRLTEGLDGPATPGV